jgi:hypothetical protein
VLEFIKKYEGECEILNGGAKGEVRVRVLTFSVLLEKRELTVKPPLLKP